MSTNTASVSREPDVVATPDDDMRRAFEEQLSETLIRDALRYASERTKLVVMAGRRRDRQYAKDLVQGALVDIWMGKVAWDPASYSLLDRVIWLVKARSFKDAQWIERLPHVAMDGTDELVAIQAQASHRLPASPQDRPIMLEALAREVIGKLRALAGNDDAVRRILDAWSDGLIERIEVLAATGLSAAEYKTARARLLYLVDDLPQELKTRVINLLRDAS